MSFLLHAYSIIHINILITDIIIIVDGGSAVCFYFDFQFSYLIFVSQLQELLEYMPGPDFPTGGLIMGNLG